MNHEANNNDTRQDYAEPGTHAEPTQTIRPRARAATSVPNYNDTGETKRSPFELLQDGLCCDEDLSYNSEQVFLGSR